MERSDDPPAMSVFDDPSRSRAPARLGLSLLGLALAVGTFSFVAAHRSDGDGTALFYGGSFYRFEASYIVRDTGEPLSVDVVVPCQRTLDRYPGRAEVRSTLAAADEPHPFLATARARNGSLVVAVPRLCGDADGVRPGQGRVVPKAVWYSAPSRLGDPSTASDQGDYASSSSKVEFLSAAVVPAGFHTYAAFVHRRIRSGPVEGEGTPFGYSEAQIAAGVPAAPRRLEATAE